MQNSTRFHCFKELYVEYKRPWKLASLIIGIMLLVVGSFYYQAPDWDIPISLIMAVSTYLTAGWCLRILLERRWKYFPLMLFWTWLSVDGLYAAYWYVVDPQALALMRSANFGASLVLFVVCGLIWLPRMSLKTMWQKILSD